MEEQKSLPATERKEMRGVCKAEREEKLTYVPPKTGLLTVELENNIAAGSISVRVGPNEEVEESWLVKEDDTRDVDLDFFK